MAKPSMTDDELLGAIESAEALALGTLRGEISTDRADAEDRYLGRPYGNEKAGRSALVSRDVADVVEGVKANVIKPFVAGEEIVRFLPNSAEDEDASQQETDYVNHIFLTKNNGFVVLASAVHDALLKRNGYVKVGWTKRADVMIETYQGQSEDQAVFLLQDPEVELVGQSSYPDPMAPPDPVQPPPMLYDLKVRRKASTEYAEVVPVPPDEMIVSERTRTPNLQESDFVQHRTYKMVSELRQLGYEVDDEITDDDSGDTVESRGRQRFGVVGQLYEDPTSDPARRIVLFKESYLRIDRDGDGIAELRRVCSVGHNLLADEEVEFIPIACFTSTILPHQHLGVSVYDMIKDVAETKTALLRAFMDNKYLANNGRNVVDVDRVNVDDLLDSRPGGVVRVTGDPSTAVLPLVSPDTGASALQGLEYLDTVRENRTGYTRNTAGMESNALTNKTLGGMAMQLSQSQMRLEMVSRTIAETGVRDLFRIIHATTLKHATKAEKLQLRGKWVAVNPREWVRRTDLTISVGLGAGNADQQFGKLQMIAPFLQQAQAMGLAGPEEAYNFGAEMLKSAGYKNPDKFIHPPEQEPVLDQQGQPVMGEDGKPKTKPKVPPPPKDPLVQAEEVKGQIALKKHTTVDATEEKKAMIDAAVKMKGLQSKGAIDGAKLGLQVQQQGHDQQMDKLDGVAEIIGKLGDAIEAMNAPKEIVRDGFGRAKGLRRA